MSLSSLPGILTATTPSTEHGEEDTLPTEAKEALQGLRPPGRSPLPPPRLPGLRSTALHPDRSQPQHGGVGKDPWQPAAGTAGNPLVEELAWKLHTSEWLTKNACQYQVECAEERGTTTTSVSEWGLRRVGRPPPCC